MDLGYARVSTTKQDLQRQIDALTSAGVPAERIYVDKKSGATTDRPGLAALLDYARAGDVIVVHTLDRLGRTVRDTLNLIHDLTGREIGLRNLADPIKVDTTDPDDPMGQLAIVLLALFAQMERTYTLERVAHARSVAEATGRRPGRPSTTIDASKLAWAVHLRDVDGLSVDEIVERTKIPRTSLYRHLPPRPAAAITANGVTPAPRTDTPDGVTEQPSWHVAGPNSRSEPKASAASSQHPGHVAEGPPRDRRRPHRAGDAEQAREPYKVHMPAGTLPVGDKFKAVCACGWTTRPRSTEQAALDTLGSKHGVTETCCRTCRRDRCEPGEANSWGHLKVLTDPATGDQFLVCADDEQACWDAGTRRQLELDQAAAAALGIDPPRTRLRLLTADPVTHVQDQGELT